MEYRSAIPYSWEVRSKYLDLPFPESEYEERLSRVRQEMAKKGIDSIIVFGNSLDKGDLMYLSNFYPFGRAALIVGRESPPVLITDGILHGEPINSYSWMTWIRDFRPVHRDAEEFAASIAEVLEDDAAKKVGIVGMDNLPGNLWDRLRSSVKDVVWEDFWFPFTSIKSVRSQREVSLLKEVGRITAGGMKAAVESIAEGSTEHGIVSAANGTMFELGAHELFFSTIVNAGPRGGLKHAYPTGRKIKKGDLIYLDMGASRYGYNCDMSRSVVPGGANEEQRVVLDCILDGYRRLTGLMKPGVSSKEFIEEANRLEMESGLIGKYKGRIFLGLAIHHAVGTSFAEFPTLGFPETILKENMTFAFEPMAHILDFGTAVIEDMILITGSGQESITPYEIVHW
jgi:Xaa-Pro aminopeptidase